MIQVNPVVTIQSLRYLDWREEISVRLSVTTMGMTKDVIFVYMLNKAGLINEHRLEDHSRLFDRQPPLVSMLPRNILWGAPQPVPSGF